MEPSLDCASGTLEERMVRAAKLQRENDSRQEKLLERMQQEMENPIFSTSVSRISPKHEGPSRNLDQSILRSSYDTGLGAQSLESSFTGDKSSVGRDSSVQLLRSQLNQVS